MPNVRHCAGRPWARRLAAGLLLASGLAACAPARTLAKLAAIGDSRELRDSDDERPRRSDTRPKLLVLALDGVRREVLYDMLEHGRLPGLDSLLGGRQGHELPHAYLHPAALAPFPSVTVVGWSSIFTGAPPAVNGIPGNEFFIREERRFVAPIPGSFEAKKPVLETYTDDYANRLLRVPTVYERLREQEPDISIWVSVSQFYRGADRLLIAPRSGVIDMMTATTKDFANGESYAVFEERDRKIIDAVIDQVDDEDEPVPDVLTVYASGSDGFQHAAPQSPDVALRSFLAGDLDRMLGGLHEALERRGALADRYVVLVSDHGHSEVPHDASTMLSSEAENAPPAVLTGAGFRLRPLTLDTERDDFQAVLAYQGPVAFVYLADRSRCPKEGDPCDWTSPPRFREDVLAAADAYYEANRTGRRAPRLRGSLDLVLARRPRPYAEDDLPFEVYVGHGRLVPVRSYLKRHPRHDWIEFESRLRDLAVGRYGERAGDVLLMAKSGAGAAPDARHYFAVSRQESVHGSPSRRDSEVPLILAHPGKSSGELRDIARRALGDAPRTRQVAELLLQLRGDGVAPSREPVGQAASR